MTLHDYDFDLVPGHELLPNLSATLARHRETSAEMLPQIASVDVRGLYAEAGCTSMKGYCVDVLKMTEDLARKRIRAAHLARRFPAILPLVAAERLSLTAVLILGAHLTLENADELLAAAAGKTIEELERFL